MVNTIVWVVFGLAIAGIAGYATNTMGFRDYIDGFFTALKQTYGTPTSTSNLAYTR